MDDFRLPLIFLCLLIEFYPVLVVFLAVYFNLGAYAWLLVVGMLSPFATAWYVVVRRRLINYLKLLLTTSPANGT